MAIPPANTGPGVQCQTKHSYGQQKDRRNPTQSLLIHELSSDLSEIALEVVPLTAMGGAVTNGGVGSKNVHQVDTLFVYGDDGRQLCSRPVKFVTRKLIASACVSHQDQALIPESVSSR